MKKIAYLLFALLVFVAVHAQDPVKWTASVERKSDTEYTLIFKAVIEEHWHMYSQYTADGGSLPLELLFNNNKGNFEAVGKAAESPTKKQFNDIFGVEETFWENTAELRQEIRIINPANAIVQAELTYQVCKEACIQGDNLFEFDLKALTVKEVKNFEEVKPEVPKEAAAIEGNAKNTTSGDAENQSTDPLSIFLLTLLAGFGVTFTPCVFPMIPMTVSFFLKQNSNKARGKFNAIFYGLCIIAIYVLLSVPFHLFEGVDKNIFADISTNVYLNLFFFIIFVTFAISFFGAFEITLPSSIANKADNASNIGGMAGVFFMALTLTIVSFSCTGPVLSFVFGTVLSSDGGALLLSLGMLGFGLGLALPFMVFALFPNLMGNLPKSGGWLNTVKVVFGFIELALAFKFLSNADLVLQLHWFEREVFLAIWIAVFGALSLYLFGKFSMPHDSPLQFLSVGRMLFAVLTLSFTLYLVPGLWGAPLKLISGITPPLNYSESPFGFGGSSGNSGIDNEMPSGAVKTVHGLMAFEDYDKGLAYAKQVGKPLLLDFSGRVCTNCRKMEEYVWVDPKVLQILKNDVVLVSLFCDEQIDLPENEHYISKYSGRKITTVGKKWSDFQQVRFNANARPYYVLLDSDGNQIPGHNPIGYTPDVAEYEQWLKSGIAKY